MTTKSFRIEHWSKQIQEHLWLWNALQGIFRVAQESDLSLETLPKADMKSMFSWLAQLQSMQDAQHIPSLKDLFSRQMLIVAGSMVGGILEDAFFLVFQRIPERMRNRLRVIPEEEGLEQARNNGSDLIRFEEILRSSTKEALIDSLAERATTTQNQGKIETILKRFLSVSNCGSEPASFAGVREIMGLRHKSAHEVSPLSISPEKVESFYLNVLPRFLDDIEEILASCGIFSDRDVDVA